MPWVPVHVKPRVHPPRVESLVPLSPVELLQSSPTGFQSQTLWRLFLLIADPQAGEPDVGLRTLTSYGRVSVICLFSSLWVTLPPDMGVDYKTEAFLPSHCDFFGCRISFLVALSPFLSMAIQQSVVILVFLCKEVSSCPTPPSCLLPPPPP